MRIILAAVRQHGRFPLAFTLASTLTAPIYFYYGFKGDYNTGLWPL
jgi:hypothetical protein